MTAPKSLGPLIRRIIPDDLLDLTDEEWDERDAKVKAEAERARFVARNKAWADKKRALLDRGLALRHLQNLVSSPLTPTPAMDAIRSIDCDGTYVLSGNAGCGKTHAAHVWLLEAHKLDRFEWKASQVRMATAAWFARQSRYGNDKFELLSEVPRLVLDDLGVEYADSKQSYLVDFDELLDLRWRAGLPTLLTTNLDQEEFYERYRDRIFDRVSDDGRWFNVDHPSMRGT